MTLHHSAMLRVLLLGAALAACGQPEGAVSGSAPANLTTNGVDATMTVDSWGAGYCANIALANTSTAPVTSWTLVVALNGTTLNNLWGGTSSVSGGQLTIRPLDYNTNIAPGATATLGFCGSGTATPALSTLTVVGGGTGPTTQTLTVSKVGSGTVTSAPAGIDCGSTCSAAFSTGAVVTLTATPASGASFNGWSGACTGSVACVVSMSAAQTVTATFGPGEPGYTLTVLKAGTGTGTVAAASGINCGATCSATYAPGTSVTLTAMAGSGSVFAGWSSTCPGFASGALTLNASCTVTATFNLSDPGSALSVNAGGAAAGSFVADAYFTGGSTYTTTNAIDTAQITGAVPPQAVFQSERYGEFTYTIPNRTPGSAQTVTLYFQESYWTAAGQRTFNVAINGAGVLTAFDIFAAAGGANRAIARTFNTTASSTGQVVIAFTKGGGPDNPKICGISVAGGSVATFPLTVTRAGNGGGTVTSVPAGVNCGSTCSASFASGAAVTLSAAAASGSTFAGWSGAGCSGTSTCTVSMTTAQAVTATFTTQVTTYALTVAKTGTGVGTVTSNPAGINCGSTCAASYASGTTVTLSAAAASGSTFGGWSNGCTGTAATCVVSMTAARTVSASFTGGGDTRPSAGCGKTRTLQNGTISIQSNGTRTYVLRAPDNYSNTRPYRLVMAYHWLNGSAQNVVSGNYYGLLPLSNNSTIFVAPQGLNAGWANSNGQDVAFTDAMLNQLLSELCIDRNRIFATGFSYGAGMSYALACQRADVFRGVALYAGAQLSGCVGGTSPIAYFAAHGMADSVLNISQGRTLRDRFVRNNGCTPQNPPEPAAGSGTHICTSYQGCSAGHPVRWCAHTGDHNPSEVDRGQTTSWIPPEAWAFISQF
jgi:poly(3-hydroxybutyrate) depolymerase